jgi:DNA-binding beta-propeller fold protein YncE
MGAGMTEEESLVRVPQVMASGRSSVLHRLALLAIGAAVLTCFFGTGTASALETRLLQKSFKPTSGFANFGPQGVAVDQNTETVYVADAGAGTVFVFEADGTPASKPQLTKADGSSVYPFGTPIGVAVDNSGGATEGYVYVTDASAKEVRQFDATGSATAFDPITVTDLPQDGTAQAGGLLPVANSGSWAPNGVAVGATGDIYVADPANGVVDVFSSSGTFLRQLGSGQLPSAVWVAVDSAGNTYATGSNGLVGFDAAGKCLDSCTPIDPAGTLGVAIDSSDNVYVSEGSKVAEYDSTGTRTTTFGGPTVDPGFAGLQLAFGVAVNSSSEAVYVIDLFPDASNVNLGYIFGPLVTVPDTTTEAATNLRPDAATLNGTVDPDGAAVTSCEFEYGITTSYGQTVPCAESGGDIGTGTDPVPVHADISGLTVDGTYFFRLVAGNADGSVLFPGAELTTTPAVGLVPQAPSEDDGHSLQLNALVKDWSSALTGCHFEYVTEAGYQANGASFSDLKTGGSIPCDPEASEIPVDDAEHLVSAGLTGLIGNSPYRWRIVATSGNGTSSSAAQELTTAETPPIVETGAAGERTLTSAVLNGRLNPSGLQSSYFFEYGTTTSYGSRAPAVSGAAGNGRSMVPVSEEIGGLQPGTPYHFRLVAENSAGTEFGADGSFQTVAAAAPERAYELVSPAEKNGANVRDHGGFQASEDGNAVAYSGITALASSAEDAPYLGKWVGRRSPDGWSVNSTDAPQVHVPTASWWTIGLTHGISDDGTKALTMSLKALAPGAVEGESNLYLHDLVTNEYTTVVSNPDPTWWGEQVMIGLTYTAFPFVQGTPDFDHVLVRSSRSLQPGVPGNALFDFTEGELKLISRSPVDGHPIEGSGLTFRGDSHAVNLISRDGKRIAFTSASEATAPAGGSVALISNEGEVTAISESRRSADPPGTLRPARVFGGGIDVNEVYISSRELLDGDAPGVNYLYRYVPATDDLERLAPMGEEFFSLQVSADGSTIYFESRSALLPGAQENLDNIYVWRNGSLSLATTIPSGQLGLGAQTWWVSPDGRYIDMVPATLLDPEAAADPSCQVGGNSNFPCREVYRYDADAGEFLCVSCQANGKLSGRPMPWIGGYLSDTSPFAFARSVNNDGDVFFDSPDQLVPADTNSFQDVYEYSDEYGLRLLSDGSGSGSLLADVSADGRDVFFTTADRLVRADFDNSVDIYDARIGGGIPSQNAVPPSACNGEDCRGQVIPPPPPPPGGSETTFGPGNAQERKARCPKGKHAKKVKGKRRCVKNAKKQSRKNRTSNERRQGR